MTLPNDISRCAGRLRANSLAHINSGLEPMSPCVDCQRRTDPGEGEHISNMSPPEFIGGICLMRIAPDGGERT